MRRLLATVLALAFLIAASPAQAHNRYRNDPRDPSAPGYMDIVRIRVVHQLGSDNKRLIIRTRQGWTRKQLARQFGGRSFHPTFGFIFGTNAGIAVWVNKRGRFKGFWWEGDDYGTYSSRAIGKPSRREVGVRVTMSEWDRVFRRWRGETGYHEITFDRTGWLRHRI